MELKNGYKVIYEVAADGKRTFYASKSNVYPAAGDVELASFTDADYVGKVIYEYKGDFYVSTGSVPAYDEAGVPTDTKIAGFDKVFVEAEEVEEDEAVTPDLVPEEDNGANVEPNEGTETNGPTYDLPEVEEEEEE